MQWHSAADFFAMGGYALYVWVSFGACALCMLGEPWLLARRRARILAQVRQAAQMERAELAETSMKDRP